MCKYSLLESNIFNSFFVTSTTVDDTLYIKESIWDYKGIDLSDKSVGTGPYTCEMFLSKL